MTVHCSPRDEIRLRGLQLRACHGVMPHEQEIPQTFVVDLSAKVDLFTPSMSDELDHSVDYSKLAATVARVVLGPPVKLIEYLAGQIADEIMREFSPIQEIAVTVHKPHAPLNELVADVSVTVSRVRDERTSRIW